MERLHPIDIRIITAAILATDNTSYSGEGWQVKVAKHTNQLIGLVEKEYPTPDDDSPNNESALQEAHRRIRVGDDHALRLLDENDKLREELQKWAEAQDSLRSGWLEVVAALAEIVPEIPGETTLSMVKRIKAQHDEAQRIIQALMIFDCRCIAPCNCHSEVARKAITEGIAFLKVQP